MFATVVRQRRLRALLGAIARAGSVVVIAGYGLTVSGCQSFRNVSQCNKLIGIINTELAQAAELHAQPPTTETYKALSELYARLEIQVVEMPKTDSDLDRNAKNYAKQVKRVSREARNFSQAIERLNRAEPNSTEAKQAQDELVRIRQRAGRLLDAAGGDAQKLRDGCRPKG